MSAEALPPINLILFDLNFSASRYALDLFNATRPHSKLIVLRHRRRGVYSSAELRAGEDYVVVNTLCRAMDLLPLGLTLCLRVNSLAFGLFNKRLAKGLSSGEVVVHYTVNMFPPVSFSGTHIVTVHDMLRLYERSGGLAHRNWKWSVSRYRRFPYVVVPTRYVAKQVEESGLLEGKIFVIPHAVSPGIRPLEEDKKELRRRLGLPTDKVLLLSISADLPRKNLKAVKEAAEALGPGYALVRVGPPVGSSITFRNVSLETLNMIYNAADVLLFPTLAEGFGYPAAEAMAAGLPVVTSDIEVMREVCGDAAVFVNPHDVSDIVRGVREALSASEQLRRKGLERARLYSFETFRKRYAELYSTVMPPLRDLLSNRQSS